MGISTDFLLELGMYESSYRNSRMKKTLLAEPGVLINKSQHLYQVATIKGEIVGLALIERLPRSEHNLMLLNNQFSDRSTIKAKSSKKFVCDGFFQVYVKPEFRGRGIAKRLAKSIITKHIKNCSLSEDRLPMVVAMDGAREILKKYVKDIYTKKNYVEYIGYKMDIHYETLRCMDVMDLDLKPIKKQKMAA